MRKAPVLGLLLLFAAALMLATGPGCGGKKEEKPGVKPPTEEKKPSEEKKGAEVPKAKGAIVGESNDGVIKGKIVYDGTPPKMLPIKALLEHKDCKDSPEDQKVDQTWRIGKGGGVANAVVYLRAPAGSFFPVKKEQVNKIPKEVVIDQPHCVYVPHVAAVFSYYKDETGKEQETGQKMLVKNSAKFTHNTGFTTEVSQTNWLLGPGNQKDTALKPQRIPIPLGCNVHSWMTAQVWSFDHPYFAVTGEDGTFEIQGVPTGVEVMVIGWHEATKNFYGGKTGEKTTLKKGETKTLDLKIKTP